MPSFSTISMSKPGQPAPSHYACVYVDYCILLPSKFNLAFKMVGQVEDASIHYRKPSLTQIIEKVERKYKQKNMVSISTT